MARGPSLTATATGCRILRTTAWPWLTLDNAMRTVMASATHVRFHEMATVMECLIPTTTARAPAMAISSIRTWMVWAICATHALVHMTQRSSIAMVTILATPVIRAQTSLQRPIDI